MVEERIVRPTPLVALSKTLNEIVGGRSEDQLKKDIAQALWEEHAHLSHENIMTLLGRVKPRAIRREGTREQPVTEILAIVDAAIQLRRVSLEPKQWPRVQELAARLGIVNTELINILQKGSFPRELRALFITPNPNAPQKK